MWASYKAVVRRDGVFQSSVAGHRDFNSDLVEPIMKRLAPSWERVFQASLPQKLAAHIDKLSKLLHEFHGTIEEHANDSGVGLSNLSILKTQIFNHEQTLKDLDLSLRDQMNGLQREANREFTPSIEQAMRTAYTACVALNGRGSYKLMKDHMANHVDNERHTMFHKAVRRVEKHLTDMGDKLQESMQAKVNDIFAQIDTDYTHALGNQPTRLQSKEERELTLVINRVRKSYMNALNLSRTERLVQ
jgi:hypothetical protein